MLKTLTNLNIIVIVIMSAAYFYHAVYTVVGLIYRKRLGRLPDAPPRRFAALICARNEASVIAELVGSLKKQDYPAELLDIYVLADNCTDCTAAVARQAGAIVYERFNSEQVGKGYALDYLLAKIARTRGDAFYDGYFVFDADNIVDPAFVKEMNKSFARGFDVVTCYRNSKNFATNWITYSYSVWFLHEARFINFPRMLLGNGCAVSGTGFMVASKVIRENGGWPFHLLTEDIQFSVSCAVSGRKIGYCDTAVVYDEQPETFSQSWTQRMRWAKGFYQVDRKYLLRLFKGVFSAKGRRMTCYDIMMTVAPGMLFSVLFTLLNVVVLVACIDAPLFLAQLIIGCAARFLVYSCLWAYLGLLGIGLLTVLCEWKRINARASRKLLYLGLFPLFMATYIPIALAALLKKVEWKPIRHSCAGSAALTAQKRG